MCIKCELKKAGLTQIKSSNTAIDKNGNRTIWGPYVESDFEKIQSHYPVLSEDQLKKFISFFHEPRLSELLGPLELLTRMIKKQYSQIRGLEMNVAYNPLSILTHDNGTVLRIKTTESELLHKSMEKLSLRTKTMNMINDMFDNLFGFQLAFACSCGIGAVYSKDLQNFMNSEYYCQREGYGRMYDSDILSTNGYLFMSDSINTVPRDMIEKSRDVGENEIVSYRRYHNAVSSIINSCDVPVKMKDAKEFFN
jgi:hypothetical protein